MNKEEWKCPRCGSVLECRDAKRRVVMRSLVIVGMLADCKNGHKWNITTKSYGAEPYKMTLDEM
ncbi:MAG: hypothetical protein WC907_06650 [Acholeplasmataceae bacterium]|jgi:hypothetical protein